MRDSEMKLLFESLSQILFNQDDIKKHLGLNKCNSDYGWDDENTSKLAKECSETAKDYEHNDECSYW